jgi:hypothetical protein
MNRRGFLKSFIGMFGALLFWGGDQIKEPPNAQLWSYYLTDNTSWFLKDSNGRDTIWDGRGRKWKEQYIRNIG